MNHELHKRALSASRRYQEAEAVLLEILIEADRSKLYHDFECSSLFVYVTHYLKLTSAVTYSFITVARKAAQLPELRRAVSDGRISVAQASRIASRLNAQNASELIGFVKDHTCREVERKLHRMDPASARLKTLRVSAAVVEDLKRIRDFEPGNRSLEEVLAKVVGEYRLRHDPTKKAERFQVRSSKKTDATELCAHRVPAAPEASISAHEKLNGSKRVPLKASQRHSVHLRDGGRCTHVGPDGRRCPNERFLDLHHHVFVSQGGGNDPRNLQTLCGYHHDLKHQLSFAFISDTCAKHPH